MAKMTINELLDSVPLGGLVVVYAPVVKVVQEVNSRNMARRGECYDIITFVDSQDRLAIVIYRREQWNNASQEHLMQTQRFWRRTIQEWRM